MAISDLFFGRQKEIERRLVEYLEHWWGCVECLRSGMDAYLDEGPGETVDYYYSRVDKEESRGDELRRGIETELFEKALMPESRGDILRVLETMDKVVNRIESTIRQIVIERIELEPWMRNDLSRMTACTIDACQALHQAGSCLLRGEDPPIRALTNQVEDIESRCDHMEEDLMGRIFASDLDLARKLQLKDFVRRIGTISDIAESAADTVHIVSIKRQV
jgi:uncharacterized protein